MRTWRCLHSTGPSFWLDLWCERMFMNILRVRDKFEIKFAVLTGHATLNWSLNSVGLGGDEPDLTGE